MSCVAVNEVIITVRTLHYTRVDWLNRSVIIHQKFLVHPSSIMVQGSESIQLKYEYSNELVQTKTDYKEIIISERSALQRQQL